MTVWIYVLFMYELFNDAITSSGCTALDDNEQWIMNSESCAMKCWCHCLKELTITMRNLSHNSRSSSWDLNLASTEYETSCNQPTVIFRVSKTGGRLLHWGQDHIGMVENSLPFGPPLKELLLLRLQQATQCAIQDVASSTHLFVYFVYWHSDWLVYMLLVFMSKVRLILEQMFTKMRCYKERLQW
jgi:hypothetical protein